MRFFRHRSRDRQPSLYCRRRPSDAPLQSSTRHPRPLQSSSLSNHHSTQCKGNRSRARRESDRDSRGLVVCVSVLASAELLLHGAQSGGLLSIRQPLMDSSAGDSASDILLDTIARTKRETVLVACQSCRKRKQKVGLFLHNLATSDSARSANTCLHLRRFVVEKRIPANHG